MQTDRRRVLALLATGIAGSLLGLGHVHAQPAQRSAVSSVRVDVSPLRAKGAGQFADLMQAALSDALRAEFAGRIRPGAPRLVVQIDTLFLSSYAGDSGDDGFFGQGGSSDSMNGTALLLGPRGQVLVRHPQLLSVPSYSGGAWYAPDNEQRRAVYLARTYAQWLGRAL